MWSSGIAMRLASAALLGALGAGVAGAGVAAAAPSKSGRDVNLHIAVQSSTMAAGGTFTDTFSVTNVGQGSADDVTVDVPFDASAVRLLGVRFDQPGAWVTSVDANGFAAALGGIGSNGQGVQMTVSFAELPGFTAGNTLPETVTYRYSNNGEPHTGSVNTQLLPAQAAPISQPISGGLIAQAGGSLTINSAIFAPGEAIAFWYNTSDGQALPLYVRGDEITADHQHKEQVTSTTTREVDNGAYLNADDQGMLAATFSTKDIASGSYTLVAHGTSSGATAVFAFTIQ